MDGGDHPLTEMPAFEKGLIGERAPLRRVERRLTNG
jgi:hypothetical protein